MAVNMTEEQMEFIGKYVKSRLPEWMKDVPVRSLTFDKEIDLLERMVRVEEEVKAQREVMTQGFAQVDKRLSQQDKFLSLMEEYNKSRFEGVDQRFDSVDQRLDRMETRMDGFDDRFEGLNNALRRFMYWSVGLSVTTAGIIIGVIKFI